MTDATADRFEWASPAFTANLRKRKRSELWLKSLGLGAISIAFAMLALLIGSLISTGYHAFTKTHVTVEVYLDPDLIDADNPDRGNFRQILTNTMQAEFPEVAMTAPHCAA